MVEKCANGNKSASEYIDPNAVHSLCGCRCQWSEIGRSLCKRGKSYWRLAGQSGNRGSELALLVLKRLVADVLAAPSTRPTNAFYRSIGLEFRLGNGRARRRYAEHAPSRGDDFSILHRRARVKDLDVFGRCGVVQSSDRMSRVI